jgi:hypothetical protein
MAIRWPACDCLNASLLLLEKSAGQEMRMGQNFCLNESGAPNDMESQLISLGEMVCRDSQ